MHFVATTDGTSPGSSSRSNGSGYGSNNGATAGFFTASDRFPATKGAATASARDSSALDGACGYSNPTGPQHVHAGSRSPWQAYSQTWTL
uniref:Ultrabithorax n=1 Tax=Romanomermis culicivorax TaxID=13658 RepID=A0A915I3J7_ROMCU